MRRRRSEERVEKTSCEYASGNQDFIVDRELDIRRWPKIISYFMWKLKKPLYAHHLFADGLRVDIDFETEHTTVDDENLHEWFKTSTVGEVRFTEVLNYTVHPTKTPRYMSTEISIAFLDPTDLVLFKLRFG